MMPNQTVKLSRLALIGHAVHKGSEAMIQAGERENVRCLMRVRGCIPSTVVDCCKGYDC